MLNHEEHESVKVYKQVVSNVLRTCDSLAEIIGMDIYYLNLRCMSKRVVSCYEGLNQVR